MPLLMPPPGSGAEQRANTIDLILSSSPKRKEEQEEEEKRESERARARLLHEHVQSSHLSCTPVLPTAALVAAWLRAPMEASVLSASALHVGTFETSYVNALVNECVQSITTLSIDQVAMYILLAQAASRFRRASICCQR